MNRGSVGEAWYCNAKSMSAPPPITLNDQPPAPPNLTARKTVIITLGVVEALFGIGYVLMALVMFAGPAPPNSPVQFMLGLSIFYGITAVLVLWTAIGLIRLRSWARIVTLVFSWLWFAMGLFSMLVMGLMRGTIEQQMSAQDPPATLDPKAMGVVLIVMGIIFIAIPLAFIGVLTGKKAAMATLQGKEGYAPARPIPLSILAVYFMIVPVSFVILLLMPNAPLVVFGHAFYGAPARLMALAFAAVAAYAAWGFWNKRIEGWYAGMALSVIWTISGVISVLRPGAMEAAQRASAQAWGLPSYPDIPHGLYYIGAFIAVAVLAFVALTRRNFDPA
jgi:hypothetical protein